MNAVNDNRHLKLFEKIHGCRINIPLHARINLFFLTIFLLFNRFLITTSHLKSQTSYKERKTKNNIASRLRNFAHEMISHTYHNEPQSAFLHDGIQTLVSQFFTSLPTFRFYHYRYFADFPQTRLMVPHTSCTP